jgi:hypothetical protein
VHRWRHRVFDRVADDSVHIHGRRSVANHLNPVARSR